MPSDILGVIAEQFRHSPLGLRQLFLKILGARLFSEANDIKRTKTALAKEIGWSEQNVADVFSGQANIEQTLQLLSLVIQTYPVSLKDLWLDLPIENGCVLVTPAQSKASARIFSRPSLTSSTSPSTKIESSPYYEYRDTAMAPQAPFRPEWILELRQVSDANPDNPKVIYNKGHLMNQFTFFIGEVNFYWEDQGKKHACEMNTGDSCHITPFAPHSFASRNPDQPGLIIAVTYGDQLRRANNQLAMDAQARPSYLKDVFSTTAQQRQTHSPFNLALRFHFDADLQSCEQLAEQAAISVNRLKELLAYAEPNTKEVNDLAKALLLRPEDLFQPIAAHAVEIANFEQSPWIDDLRTTSRHKNLARSQSQPGMKSFIFEIGLGSKQRLQQHAYHQYAYNYSDQPIQIFLQDEQSLLLEPGGSCYIQPYIAHAFGLESTTSSSKTASLLIVRLANELNQAATIELSQINQAGRQRLLSENSQWF